MISELKKLIEYLSKNPLIICEHDFGKIKEFAREKQEELAWQTVLWWKERIKRSGYVLPENIFQLANNKAKTWFFTLPLSVEEFSEDGVSQISHYNFNKELFAITTCKNGVLHGIQKTWSYAPHKVLIYKQTLELDSHEIWNEGVLIEKIL